MALSLQERVDALLGQQSAPQELYLIASPVLLRERHSTANAGENDVYLVVFQSSRRAYHKPFTGVNVPLAQQYGQHPDDVPINECAAWRLAYALGSPFDELVAMCVMRAFSGEAGSLAAHRDGQPHSHMAMMLRPDLCRAAALFDSLIGQQDRHMGNFRWDQARHQLGLIDHGFSFSRPGMRLNASAFVSWRWMQGQQALRQDERDALVGLMRSGDLHGLAGYLRPDAAAALADRTQWMLDRDEILRLGEL